MGGGFKFRVYQKGKRLKTVRVTKNDKVKTVKLPKKKRNVLCESYETYKQNNRGILFGNVYILRITRRETG